MILGPILWSLSCLHAPWPHGAPTRDRLHVRPIHIIGVQTVHRKGGVRLGLVCMLLALHAVTRFLAFSACLVYFVWGVCVVKLSVILWRRGGVCNACHDARNA